MRPYILYAGILFVLVGFGCNQEKDSGVGKTRRIAEVVDQLYQEEVSVRSAARYELREERAEVLRVLTNRLRELSTKLDASYESSLHLTVEAVGDWRAEGAVPVLAEVVVYELDESTMPVGKLLPICAYYPAADALRKIGGVYVHRLMVQRLEKEKDPKVVRLCVWVLYEAYGENVARLMLEAAEARTQDSGVRERLAAAKKLVAEGPRLLTRPEVRK